MGNYKGFVFIALISVFAVSGCVVFHTEQRQPGEQGIALIEKIDPVEFGYSCVWYNSSEDRGSCMLGGADQVGALCTCFAREGTRFGSVR